MAIAVTGLAAGGLTLLSGNTAQAAPHISSCLYRTGKVTAARTGPGRHFHIVTNLPKGFIIRGSCQERDHHWVRIFDPANFKKVAIADRFVFRNDLFMVTGSAAAGGGGTSNEVRPLLPAALGAITLGGGIALAAWRRRPSSPMPTT
ncbi:MAG TPA: hypothetical protein VF069_10850 [Streptosporangiaceae bacterium]